MIEGEAEILQSSSKPTVLHGRPGMTVKFIDADDVSKVVIAELEKARLAMKPAPPSVPPRPTEIPAEPRAVVPAVGGRIDAANALAECVVIGDASQLVDTANAPKSVTDAGSGKAKFAVPSIPGVGTPRAHTPSEAPTSRPNSTSTPPPISGVPSSVGASPSGGIPRPKSPSIPPDPASRPLPMPSKPLPVNSRLTSVGFPAIDKQPAFPAKTNVPGVTPITSAPPPAQSAPNSLLETKHGTAAPTRLVGNSKGMPALEKPVTGDEATAIGEVPPGPPKKKTDPMPAAAAMNTQEPTTVGEVPPKKGIGSVVTAQANAAPTSAPQAPSGPTPLPPKLPSGPSASRAAPSSKMTSIGFPAVRTPFETQPVGVVRPPGAPQPPVVPGDGASAKSGAASPGPRGKNPTRQPLSPRHPTPVAPVPIVRMPGKAAPQVDDAIVAAIEEEEKTDLSNIPQPPRSTGAFAVADTVDARIDPIAQAQVAATRSGGMRASEILAAIPSDDWTMSPDASGPTVVPAAEKPAAIEPTKAPKGPLTGNWSISLDPEAPEAGWSEPVKLEKSEAPEPAPAPKPKPKSVKKRAEPGQGNPDKAISDEKGFTAVEWEEKPTGIGEAKIEIDSTLMEPLKPMPAFDDDADPLSAPPAAGSAPRMIKYITPPAGMPASRVGPNPFASESEASPYAAQPASDPTSGYVPAVQTLPGTPPPVNAGYGHQAMQAPRSQLFANAGGDPNAQYQQADYSGGAALAPDAAAAARRKRTILIGAGALAALAGGFVLVLLLVGGKTKKAPPSTTKAGSGSAHAVVERGSDDVTPTGSGTAEPAVGSGSVVEEPAGSGSAVAAIVVPVDSGVEEKPAVVEGGPCNVSIASVPNGAEVYQADKKIGTTPFSLEMPCGIDAKVTLRKAKFINTARSFTPADGKANKVVVKLAKTTFTLKVTSSPAGATINIGGRSVGVTPTTIRLPAYEASAIVVSKPGYAADSKTVTPKSNNISHHVVLKKGRR